MRFIPQIVVRDFYAASRSRSEVVFGNFDNGIEMYLITPLHMVIAWTTIGFFATAMFVNVISSNKPVAINVGHPLYYVTTVKF